MWHLKTRFVTLTSLIAFQWFFGVREVVLLDVPAELSFRLGSRVSYSSPHPRRTLNPSRRSGTSRRRHATETPTPSSSLILYPFATEFERREKLTGTCRRSRGQFLQTVDNRVLLCQDDGVGDGVRRLWNSVDQRQYTDRTMCWYDYGTRLIER